jgi:hypothetical protein
MADMVRPGKVRARLRPTAVGVLFLVSVSVPALSATPVLAAPARAASTSSQVALVTSLANWILAAQLPVGAIAVDPPRPRPNVVWPYLANFAAMGLARATAVSGDGHYLDRAWAYLRWYSHAEQATTGYVTNYDIVDGSRLVSTGSYDSTDAYAGTFLAAVWDAYSVRDDLDELRSTSAGVEGAISAIASTQQPDGLTWAEPRWHVAYLMDNVQVLGGLEAAAAIERVLGHRALEVEATRRESAVRAGIAGLWDPATDAYDWAFQQDGSRNSANWRVLYPDALEQVTAVEWGAAVGKNRAADLMARFSTAQPDWSDPRALAAFRSGSGVTDEVVGYWPSGAIALNAVGRRVTAATGLGRILSAAEAASQRWPFTTGDAGEAILAASDAPLVASTGVSPHARPSARRASGTTTSAVGHRHLLGGPGRRRSYEIWGIPLVVGAATAGYGTRARARRRHRRRRGSRRRCPYA